jgi:hypothetical protein
MNQKQRKVALATAAAARAIDEESWRERFIAAVASG